MSKRPQLRDICPDSKKIKMTGSEEQHDSAKTTKDGGSVGTEGKVEETTAAAAEIHEKGKTLPQEACEQLESSETSNYYSCDQLNSSQTLDYSSDTVPDSTLDPGETKYFSDCDSCVLKAD